MMQNTISNQTAFCWSMGQIHVTTLDMSEICV